MLLPEDFTKPDGFERWNPAMRGAYVKGWRARREGLELSDCPYIDRRKDCGRLTWSRAFIAAWRDGHDDARRYEFSEGFSVRNQ